MPGSMAPLKKPRNTARVPLALNPLKSKDVLAVLAERNQAIMPVGAWVEPALPDSSEVPAYTSAYMIEEELKEKLRKKQEALKHFQRQVKRRVNQQIRLRKKQQFQRSYEAAEKEGSIAMQSSDPARLTPKRTSVFPDNLNVAIGSAGLPPSQMLGDGMDDRENQNELFQQQAQALSQTMKEARHRLASFKTVNKKNASVFADSRRKTSPPQEEPDFEESSSITTDKETENLFWEDQHSLLSEDSNKPFSRVQKVQFKNPLFATMKEEEQKQLDLQGLQNILPEAQDYLPEGQGDLLEAEGDLTGVQSVELEAESVEPEAKSVEPKLSIPAIELESQAVEPKAQPIEPKAQAVKIKTQGIMPEAQNIEPEDESIVSEVQDLLPKEQCVLPKDQNNLPRCQDQDFLLKDQDLLLKDQNILPECQDQHFPPKDHHVLPEDQNSQSKFQDQDFLLKDQHQHFLPREQETSLKQPASILIGPRGREAFPLDVQQDLPPGHQDQTSTRDKKVRFKESYSDVSSKKGREDYSLAGYQYLPPKLQDQTFIRDQSKYIKQPSSYEKWEIERRVPSGVPSSLYFRRQPSVGTAERWREDLLLDDHEHLPAKHQREACSKRQVYDEYQSRLSTEFQIPLTLQSGVDQEEDKRERQKQYLRYRRLFMDIEREQVKEQQRQKEHQKKVEKIKKKKEQQRYAEEQRILRMNFHEELYSGEKMSDILAQMKLEELKGVREKQQQREKESQRYMEALRVQIQEKMRLYNITLPPLCCCGPDFWDAHPDTCANNCIFYKNRRAYTRALHSVINSCDIPEGTSTVRVAMHNLASAHRRTLKNL
ncbi:coiled-coil domain-containing protein 15 isoform X1 [Mustela lutreola]|uniref:coiled-coil domain-containing protein 15 isoform X1 n=2 Tax=Mustela lutreola TaxID=9666 RepID=UPI002797A9AE|nr:coiled-coil domain-containing protein 15 isoform X1 [Mustela lutreola]XP_059039831.1 coiled-coil domain-containing protein 15 isoform X1 [Mustela lutreola]XP_059039835.1 coiled-coil domain-containing protein 15 isoform X1 [Mustela lutreola]